MERHFRDGRIELSDGLTLDRKLSETTLLTAMAGETKPLVHNRLRRVITRRWIGSRNRTPLQTSRMGVFPRDLLAFGRLRESPKPAGESGTRGHILESAASEVVVKRV